MTTDKICPFLESECSKNYQRCKIFHQYTYPEYLKCCLYEIKLKIRTAEDGIDKLLRKLGEDRK